MSVPSGYTEATLATYMLQTLGPVAGVFGWKAVADISEAVNEVTFAMGVADISEVSGSADIRKLRAVARREAWRAAAGAAATLVDVQSDDQSIKRSQIPANIKAELARAESVCRQLGITDTAAPTITTQGIRYVNDPYRTIEGD